MATKIEKLRREAAARIGLFITGTPESFKNLSIQEKEQVTDEMAKLIIDNPEGFSDTQISIAENVVNSVNFGNRPVEADDSITIDKFASAFGEVAAETATATGKKAAEIGSNVAGGFISQSPLLAIGLLALVAGGVFAFFKLK